MKTTSSKAVSYKAGCTNPRIHNLNLFCFRGRETPLHAPHGVSFARGVRGKGQDPGILLASYSWAHKTGSLLCKRRTIRGYEDHIRKAEAVKEDGGSLERGAFSLGNAFRGPTVVFSWSFVTVCDRHDDPSFLKLAWPSMVTTHRTNQTGTR